GCRLATAHAVGERGGQLHCCPPRHCCRRRFGDQRCQRQALALERAQGSLTLPVAWPQAAVWAVRRAERRLSSCLFESEVLRTRGLKRSSSGRTLSGVDLLISMNKADEPLGMVLPKSLMNSSLMP